MASDLSAKLFAASGVRTGSPAQYVATRNRIDAELAPVFHTLSVYGRGFAVNSVERDRILALLDPMGQNTGPIDAQLSDEELHRKEATWPNDDPSPTKEDGD